MVLQIISSDPCIGARRPSSTSMGGGKGGDWEESIVDKNGCFK